MAENIFKHEGTKASSSSYDWESKELLLSEVVDLEAQCQALQDYNSELEESRDRYATVFDHSPVGYIILNVRGVISDANLTAATMLDIPQGNMVGLPFNVFVVKEDIKNFLGHLTRCKNTKSRTSSEFRIKTNAHSPIYVQIISIPFFLQSEQKTYYNTTIIDISNQKRVEQELQRLDRLHLIGEMAAGIAHEIRNPMTTVRGYLQLFKKRSSEPQDMEDLQLMIEELDRANGIITEFLGLAKNKNNQFLLKDINQVVEAIYPLVRSEAVLGGNRIVLELLPQLPEILIDVEEMRQVLINLIRNALQSMKHGQVTIRTFIEGGKVVLAVEDQGCGVPDDIKDQIGTPFFTTKDSGTGLGLAICYSIIQRHNATINFITSSKGTTFFIRFSQGSI